MEPNIRHKASSGGVVTGILCCLLDQALIDGVLHVGKDPLNPLKSVGCFSMTKTEVISRSGSRYAPTSLLVDLKEILLKGFRIAIVGKPCDIVGVRLFLGKNPKFSKQIVSLISFMCMGIPSYNGTYKLAKKLGCDFRQIKDFWYRGNGWPGAATIIDKEGKAHSCSYEESWGKVLSPLLNFRCKICPDGYGEFADLSCGDAWYLNNGRPDFNESEGRSILFVRTDRGEKIYIEALNGRYIHTEDYDVAQLNFIQPSQYIRKKVFWARVLALKALGDRMIDFKGFNIFELLLNIGIKEFISNFTGMIKRRLTRSRIIQNRIVK